MLNEDAARPTRMSCAEEASSSDARLRHEYLEYARTAAASGDNMLVWYLDHVVHLLGTLSQMFRLSRSPRTLRELLEFQAFRILEFLLQQCEEEFARSTAPDATASMLHGVDALYDALATSNEQIVTNQAIHLMYVTTILLWSEIRGHFPPSTFSEFEWRIVRGEIDSEERDESLRLSEYKELAQRVTMFVGGKTFSGK